MCWSRPRCRLTVRAERAKRGLARRKRGSECEPQARALLSPRPRPRRRRDCSARQPRLCADACAARAPGAALLDLALWKEPQSSGAVLGGATLVYFVFEKLRYTALALVSQAMLVLVLGCAMWTAYCRFMNKCAQPPLALRCWGTHALPPQARAAGA